MNFIKSKDAFHAGVILLVLFMNLSFGIPRLRPYSAVDEPYWTYDRTPQFWSAIKNHKWKSTDINDKPGITVATISGIGLLSVDPMLYKSLRDEPKTAEQLETIKDINFNFRLPIYIFSVLSLPLFYFLIRKATRRSVALLAVIFLGLSPIILGISLIINPDSLLWIFLPLAILARLAYEKTRSWKYLILAGVMTGLSLLTKYVANILFVFFLALPFLEYIFTTKQEDIVSFLKRSLRDIGILVIVSVAVFGALYPATWVKPEMILEGTFLSVAFKSTWPIFVSAIIFLALDSFLFKGKLSKIILSLFLKLRSTISITLVGLFTLISIFVCMNTWLGMKWFDFESIVMSPKNSEDSATLIKTIGNIFADTYSLIFGLHPIIFLFFLVALVLVLFRQIKRPPEELVIVSFVLFILLYYAGSTANYVVATIRYQISLFPLAFIIAAIGAVGIFEWLDIRKYSSAFQRSVAILVLVFILSGSLLFVRPHYFTYASALLPETHLLNFKDMGDGSYEVAQYLNSLPDVKNIRVWSDKGAVCAVFVGDCSVSFNGRRIKQAVPDYLALSTGRKRKTVSMWSATSSPFRFQEAYETAPADFIVVLGNRSDNFVKVINAKNVLKKESSE